MSLGIKTNFLEKELQVNYIHVRNTEYYWSTSYICPIIGPDIQHVSDYQNEWWKKLHCFGSDATYNPQSIL